MAIIMIKESTRWLYQEQLKCNFNLSEEATKMPSIAKLMVYQVLKQSPQAYFTDIPIINIKQSKQCIAGEHEISRLRSQTHGKRMSLSMEHSRVAQLPWLIQ